MYAIKLASLLGYRVVTTASPHNFELVKSLGALAVFDYKDPNVSMKIREWIRDQNIGPLTKGLDTISESKGSTAANGVVIESSIKLSLQAFGDAEGTLVTLRTLSFMSTGLVRLTGGDTIVPPAPEFKGEGQKVRMNHMSLVIPAHDDVEVIAEWYQLLPSWIEEGRLGAGVVPLNKKFRGLEQLDSALEFVRQGRVSGHKVVVDVDFETE